MHLRPLAAFDGAPRPTKSYAGEGCDQLMSVESDQAIWKEI